MTLTTNDIAEYISNSDSVKRLYRLALDQGFWPDFPDYRIGKLSGYLEAAKIEDITTIDNLVSENFPVIQKFVAEIFAHRKNGQPWRLNSVFLCELVLILKYPKIFGRDFLAQNDWDEEIAEIISKAAIRLSPTNAS